MKQDKIYPPLDVLRTRVLNAYNELASALIDYVEGFARVHGPVPGKLEDLFKKMNKIREVILKT